MDHITACNVKEVAHSDVLQEILLDSTVPLTSTEDFSLGSCFGFVAWSVNNSVLLLTSALIITTTAQMDS